MTNFYAKKRVLVTGHTGFKGSYLSKILLLAGAEVTGYALEAPTFPSLFSLLNLAGEMRSIEGDVRDFDNLYRVFKETRPEIVFHLAAQPIVSVGYKFPRETFETNVMGTCNLLECVRRTSSCESVLNVTTDKVYLNAEEERHAFREEEPLDGFDPYSNSKSCSELVTHSYFQSFLQNAGVAVSTARAGNVIGGGDFALNRILPDCVRAAQKGEKLLLRNPASTRPYQHVFEALFAYLLIAARQYENKALSGAYNVGPDECDCVTTEELARLFQKHFGEGFSYSVQEDSGFGHEASFLKLDSSKLKRTLLWRPKLHIDEAVALAVRWTKVFLNAPSQIKQETEEEIKGYFFDGKLKGKA